MATTTEVKSATTETKAAIIEAKAADSADSIHIYCDVDSSIEREDEIFWMLYIKGSHGKMRFEFVVTEPQLHTVGDWMDLADGKKNLLCYQGNGGGGFTIKGSDIEFDANPSGAGGDVYLTVSLPLSLVAGPLRDVIKRAQAEGLPFAEP